MITDNMTDSEVIEMWLDFFNGDEENFIKKYGQEQYNIMSKPANDSIKIRHESYHDVYVYPDGHEEWISIGD